MARTALLEAALRNGVDVRVETPATRLIIEESRVRGLVVQADGVEHLVIATKGVLLASGGFEISAQVTTTYLGARPSASRSPPKAVGWFGQANAPSAVR